MSSKKPRKKKNNGAYRKYKTARAFTSSYVVAGLNKEPVMLVDATNMKPTPMSPLMYDQLNNIKHYWSVVMIVAGRESNGKFRFVTDFIECSDRLLMENLSPVIAHEHQEAIDHMKEHNELLYHGWVATTVPKCDFDNQMIEKFFNELTGVEV